MIAILAVVKIYIFLLVLGLGGACWFAHLYKFPGIFIWAASPIIGYSLLAVGSAFPLALHWQNNWPIAMGKLFMIISCLATGHYLYNRRINWRFSNWQLIHIPFLIIAVFIVVWFHLNNFNNGIFSHHLNPDAAGYIAGSNWIALHHDLTVTQSSAHEVLVSALRWGLPASLAITSLITRLSIYQVLFPVVLIIFSHCVSLMALLLTGAYQQSRRLDYSLWQIITLAVLLNGSILYFLSESFYPYILGVGYFSVFVALGQYYSVSKNHVAILGLASLSIATQITTCSELFCLSISFTVGVLILNALFLRNCKKDIYFLISILGGIVLAFPLSYRIFAFSLANAMNGNHIGYVQPTWIWPSEIIGLTNIYSYAKAYLDDAIATHLIIRMDGNIALALSIWVIFEFRKWLKNTFVWVIFLGIIALFSVNCYLNRYLSYSPYNYFYDKLSIAFAPVLIAMFFIGGSSDNCVGSLAKSS